MEANRTTGTTDIISLRVAMTDTISLRVVTAGSDVIRTARADHQLMQSTTSAIGKAIDHGSIRERNATTLRIRYHLSTINISLMIMSLMIMTCLRKKVLNLVVLMNLRQEYF